MCSSKELIHQNRTLILIVIRTTIFSMKNIQLSWDVLNKNAPLSDIRLFWIILYMLRPRVWNVTVKRGMKKGDTWCTAWFLSDGGKRRDATLLQETNRPASARLYIFRHSSQPSLSTSLALSRSHPVVVQPLLATLFFYG